MIVVDGATLTQKDGVEGHGGSLKNGAEAILLLLCGAQLDLMSSVLTILNLDVFNFMLENAKIFGGARVRQVWRLPWENNWKEVWWRLLQHGVVGAGGHRMAHKAEESLPVWLATRSRLVTCCTGAAATGAHLLDLHRSFSHQASHTTQPPRFRAAATTACVAARAAIMPNSEEGSVVCCVPSCTDCHVHIKS